MQRKCADAHATNCGWFDLLQRKPLRGGVRCSGWLRCSRAQQLAFLDRRWRIRHLKRRGDKWDRFKGEAKCWTILDGVGHVEELLIPARDFSGLGLRMLDVTKKQWSDHWVNAKSGVVTTPGQTGSFENGVGLFASTYEEQGRAMQSIGIWDRIGPGVCRWRQVWSDDGGKTWQHDWVMHWRRVV